MVSDPAVLRHVLNDIETFHKSFQQLQITRTLVGEKSVFSVTGQW